MITTLLLIIINSFLSFILSFLPVGSLPTLVTTATSYFIGVFKVMNFLLPVDTAFTLLGYVFTYYLIITGFSLYMWVYHLIRGK